MATERNTSPAEQVRQLLNQLHGEVVTREKIPYYRQVRRASERTVAVLDWREHITREPGLLAQLGVAQPRNTLVPVTVHRWERDDCACRPDRCEHGHRGNRPACDCRAEVCSHGRWVIDRVEHRTVEGIVTSGAALPGGSPGWDADGALTPLTGAGSAESAEPIGDAWHTADDIHHDLAALHAEIAAQGHQGSLVEIAAADERAGRRIAARLRSLVARARIAADYDAPIVPLRDIYCPECGGEMRVRADASSAVWCAGEWTVEGPAGPGEAWPLAARCGATWPRGAWVKLLEEAEADRAADDAIQASA